MAWLTYSNQHWQKQNAKHKRARQSSLDLWLATGASLATSTLSGCTVATGNFATSRLSLVATRPKLFGRYRQSQQTLCLDAATVVAQECSSS
jgi:hypothetical protein